MCVLSVTCLGELCHFMMGVCFVLCIVSESIFIIVVFNWVRKELLNFRKALFKVLFPKVCFYFYFYFFLQNWFVERFIFQMYVSKIILKRYFHS